MSASRPVVLVLTGLMALLLTGRTPRQSSYVELSKSRLKIPAGTFRMRSDQLIHADDAWDPCSRCSPRNEVERPVGGELLKLGRNRRLVQASTMLVPDNN